MLVVGDRTAWTTDRPELPNPTAVTGDPSGSYSTHSEPCAATTAERLRPRRKTPHPRPMIMTLARVTGPHRDENTLLRHNNHRRSSAVRNVAPDRSESFALIGADGPAMDYQDCPTPVRKSE